MPKLLERLVSQLKAKGMDESKAFAVATKSLQKAGDLAPNSQKLTKKGEKRQEMGAAGRAKDRAATKSGAHKPAEYAYNQLTNRARLKPAKKKK